MARRGDPLFGKIQVDWRAWRDVQRAVRHAADDELPKRMGQANRRTGEYIKGFVDAESDPAAVGAGRGADVRPSSSRREVLLRVGGSHRDVGEFSDVRKQPWGRRRVRGRGQSAPRRPHIRQIVEDHRDDIIEFWMDAIRQSLDPAFNRTEL